MNGIWVEVEHQLPSGFEPIGMSAMPPAELYKLAREGLMTDREAHVPP